MKKYYFVLLVVFLALFIFNFSAHAASQEVNMTITQPLTQAEQHVIVKKGTELPFSGVFWNHKEQGVYTCRQCGVALYRSQDKFDSNCGWPSFDDAIDNAVTRKLDADGKRTEILCTKCGAHLGHVFEGEALTEKNTRYCVNSVSMQFTPVESIETAIFAGGCFWGIENEFAKVEGVIDVISGYTGGKTKNPTYEAVSSGVTGHAEAVEIVFNNTKVDYETLARLFFEIHDPTQVNRQGVDVGSQYRSALFYTTPQQKEIADKLVKLLKEKDYEVMTQINPSDTFYPAEAYHQDFTAKTGRGACHLKVKRFD